MCINEVMVDGRLAAAISHWAPRFTAGGVDPGDFSRITSALTSWDDWCAAWCRAAAGHEQLGTRALAEDRTRSAGGHLAQAAVYYHFAKFLFVQDMNQLRAAHQAAVTCLDRALPYLDPPGTRLEIPFGGAVIAAVLRRPPGPGPHPAVVLIPGLDSAKEEFGRVEQVFLDRGLATLSVDGPGQGEAEYDLPIRPDWEVPGTAILDALIAQPGIDPDRIGVWGVSLGGYYAPRVASGDPRVRACIALCGPYGLGDLWDQLPQLTREAFTVRSGARDEQDAVRRARALTLDGRTSDLTRPLLIVAGRQDRIFPWQDAVRLRDSVPGPAELLLLEDGNHGCANVVYRHRPYSADWMARQLAG
ncbi:MAG TPA: alpha/beta fold hydrolase [Streptosporangiaceae bacterium]|nr:alpha/beta fold hydrolase [Streptosporangiaceae bacterium]